MITQAPKGTKDWFGDRMHQRTVIEKIMREMCKAYHIKEVITPVFEHTNLFERSVGETTDVVQKEMYTFDDKGGRSITLKPEGTAGVIRAYLENNMYAEPMPHKLFYVTPAFRYENPQNGRLRQHHQFGIEFVGSPSPVAELELITLLTELIHRIGLKDVRLHINSIGCPECRKDYNEALLAYLKTYEEQLCPTCKERMLKNPLRVLDCKVKSCQDIVQNAPKTIEYLDEECKTHFEQLQQLLNGTGIVYTIDPQIVRGLDYYTRTVFEFVNKDGFTLCGGGRYDKLIKEIDGKQDIPSIGFGMGIERILYFVEQEGISLEEERTVDLYVGVMGNTGMTKAYEIITGLRHKGLIVETDYMSRSVKAQMKYANKIKARYVVIIGDNELDTGEANLKNMETGEQVPVKLDMLSDAIERV